MLQALGGVALSTCAASFFTENAIGFWISYLLFMGCLFVLKMGDSADPIRRRREALVQRQKRDHWDSRPIELPPKQPSPSPPSSAEDHDGQLRTCSPPFKSVCLAQHLESTGNSPQGSSRTTYPPPCPPPVINWDWKRYYSTELPTTRKRILESASTARTFATPSQSVLSHHCDTGVRSMVTPVQLPPPDSFDRGNASATPHITPVQLPPPMSLTRPAEQVVFGITKKRKNSLDDDVGTAQPINDEMLTTDDSDDIIVVDSDGCSM